MLDPRTRRRHKVRNAAQAVLLLGGMVAVVAVLAWLLFGMAGLLWALLTWAVPRHRRAELRAAATASTCHEWAARR